MRKIFTCGPPRMEACSKILKAKWVQGVMANSWQVTTFWSSRRNPATAWVTGCDESSSLFAAVSDGLPICLGCWVNPET